MTHSEILDRLAWTCANVKRDGVTPQSDFARYFPTAADRLHFDGFLLSTHDPLIYQAGTVESRYTALVNRMLKG